MDHGIQEWTKKICGRQPLKNLKWYSDMVRLSRPYIHSMYDHMYIWPYVHSMTKCSSYVHNVPICSQSTLKTTKKYYVVLESILLNLDKFMLLLMAWNKCFPNGILLYLKNFSVPLFCVSVYLMGYNEIDSCWSGQSSWALKPVYPSQNMIQF